jgi:tetratricopeptide (TPR) repeat protein
MLSAALGIAGVAGCQQTQTQTNAPGAMPGRASGETPRLTATTMFAHAHLLERQGEFSRAAVQYRRALDNVPDFVAARNRLGITLNKLGRHSEATLEFLTILERHPNLAYVQNNLGFSYYLEGNYPESELALTRALELKPDFPRARMNRGVVLAKLGKYEDALEDFKASCAEGDAYFNVAMIQSEAQLYADAARSLELALRIDPKLEAARVQMREVARLAAQQEKANQDAALANAGAGETVAPDATTDVETEEAIGTMIADGNHTEGAAMGHDSGAESHDAAGQGSTSPDSDMDDASTQVFPSASDTAWWTGRMETSAFGGDEAFIEGAFIDGHDATSSGGTRVLGMTATSDMYGADNEFGLMGMEILSLPDGYGSGLAGWSAPDCQDYATSPRTLSGPAASRFSVLMQRFVQSLLDCPDESEARWAEVQQFLADVARQQNSTSSTTQD